MKLFAAVIPPPEAIAELRVAVAALRALPEADLLRWTDEEQWHFTVAFLGEVADRARPDLGERLRRAASRHQPARLRLADGGRFGDRALWVGVHGDRRAFGRLAQSAVAAGRRARVPVDERPFQPHLTLARSRTVHRSGHGEATVRLRPYEEALAGFEGSPWTAETLLLMSSTKGEPGHNNRYETLESWPIGGHRTTAPQPGRVRR